MDLFDEIVDDSLLARRVNIVANHVVSEDSVKEEESYEQLDLFTDYDKKAKATEEEKSMLDKEKKLQHALLDIKKKFGKNAVLKGMNLQKGATGKDRNNQIGGHKAD